MNADIFMHFGQTISCSCASLVLPNVFGGTGRTERAIMPFRVNKDFELLVLLEIDHRCIHTNAHKISSNNLEESFICSPQRLKSNEDFEKLKTDTG